MTARIPTVSELEEPRPSARGEHVYCREFESSVGRLLSLMNREPGHPARGSFDKTFWFYRTQRDFPDAMYLNGVLAAFVAGVALDAPVTVADLSGAVTQWLRASRHSGLLDEWYPFEGSYVATGLSSACVLLTVYLAAREPSYRGWALAEKERIRPGLERVIGALARRRRIWCENQRAIAAAVVTAAAVLYREPRWDALARRVTEDLLARQSAEGWFPEYGGFDIGYSSVVLDFLALNEWLRSDAEVRSAAAALCALLLEHVRPDGAVGGALYSRGTEYLLPFGLMYFAALGVTAATEILERHAAGTRRVRLEAMDDRYFVEYSYSWALAYALRVGRIDVSPRPAPTAPQPAEVRSRYVEIAQHGPWRTWFAPAHGGGFVSYHRDGFSVHDYGALLLCGRSILTLQTPATVIARDEDRIEVQLAPARYRGAVTPLRWGLIPFRIANYALGLTGRSAEWLSLALKRTYVLGGRHSGGMEVIRQITWDSDAVKVVYRLPARVRGAVLALGGSHRRRHVPSAHFWANERAPRGAGCYRVPPDGVARYSVTRHGLVTEMELIE